jgi:hypothetical protein
MIGILCTLVIRYLSWFWPRCWQNLTHTLYTCIS